MTPLIPKEAAATAQVAQAAPTQSPAIGSAAGAPTQPAPAPIQLGPPPMTYAQHVQNQALGVGPISPTQIDKLNADPNGKIAIMGGPAVAGGDVYHAGLVAADARNPGGPTTAKDVAAGLTQAGIAGQAKNSEDGDGTLQGALAHTSAFKVNALLSAMSPYTDGRPGRQLNDIANAQFAAKIQGIGASESKANRDKITSDALAALQKQLGSLDGTVLQNQALYGSQGLPPT